MTTITIHDEDTRRVVFQALWDHADNHVESTCCNDNYILSHYSWTKIGSPWLTLDSDPTEDAMRFLTGLDDIRAASGRLEAIELGETMEVPLDRQEFVERVDWCRQSIEEYDGLLQLPENKRAELIRVRDTAARLATEFRPAVA